MNFDLPVAKGAHIFLTGATGFVGKVVLEELMRRQTELGFEKVYLLIRGRKERPGVKRFEKELCASPCFQLLDKKVWPLFCQVIEGDLTLERCGINDEDYELLKTKTTHIIHCAASVEFDLPIAEAASFNITAALNMLSLAKQTKNLEHMVSVSTAYVTPWKPQQGPIGEVLANISLSAQETYDRIRNGLVTDEQALLKQTGHPNTYTFTKCLAEHLLHAHRENVPLTIVRPSIVSATLQMPFPGWIDSYAAFAGFVSLIGAGHLRVLAADPNSRLDVVPCDVVAERIINACMFSKKTESFKIHYAVAGLRNNPTTVQCAELIAKFFKTHPVDRKSHVRWIGLRSKKFAMREMRYHSLPMQAARLGAKATKKTKRLRQVSHVANKLKYLNTAFPYFTKNTFHFKPTFELDSNVFNKETYIRLICQGVYRHLMKRDEREMTFAGKQHRATQNDISWVLTQPRGNWAIRSFSFAVRKALKYCAHQVTFDKPSFEQAVKSIPAGTLPVLVPTHRSYMDFLLCSFLFFDRPDLGIAIPHIAAAEEFSRIPILGELFKHTHAFYIKRGQGKACQILTNQVRDLVARRQTLQFFIEGQRSRSRQFLEPRTGLLRCLQSTGEKFTIIPIAISYDKIPEEASLLRELTGSQKPEMQLRALVSWVGKMVKRKVNLGRIHLSCGAPVPFDSTHDVRQISNQVMAELQKATVTTTHHLQAFLDHTQLNSEISLGWLRKAIEERGGWVVDSPLVADKHLSDHNELCLRYTWQHFFYKDALKQWPDHPALKDHIDRNGYWLPEVEVNSKFDERLMILLSALFEPVVRDYRFVAEKLGPNERLPRVGSPRALLQEVPSAHLPHLEAAFADLVKREVLEPCAKFGHRWGRESGKLQGYLTDAHEIKTPPPSSSTQHTGLPI